MHFLFYNKFKNFTKTTIFKFILKETKTENELRDFFGYFNCQMFDELTKAFYNKCLSYLKNFGEFSNLNCALNKDVQTFDKIILSDF